MNIVKPVPDLFKTKPHFPILDGLRGVAALAIVIFHFMEWVYTDFSKNFIGHGFLAVDFFFALSGFVIGYAYDDRIKHIGVVAFFRSRLIRLHPLVLFGSVLGLAGLLFDPFSTNAGSYDFSNVLLLFVCSALLIPLPIMEERAFNLFALNAPAWSLFWEYVANIVYAFVLYRVGRRWLIPLVIAAAIALCIVTYQEGNLTGGWAGSNFWVGGSRVAYSFLAGLLVYRFNWIIKNNFGLPGLTVLLSLAFLMPWSDWNWLTESLVVIFYFPLLVSLGAGSSLSPRLEKVCKFSGDISYPLYMTHYAGIWVFANYYTGSKPGVDQLPFIIMPATLVLIFLAYLVMKFYDMPVRKYLRKKMAEMQYQPKRLN